MTTPVHTYVAPDDCFQLTLLSLIETAANILEQRAVPKSRRHNRIKAIHEQIEQINNTYQGQFPEWWVDESQKFHASLEVLLNGVLKTYRQMDNKPKYTVVRAKNGRMMRCEITQ